MTVIQASKMQAAFRLYFKSCQQEDPSSRHPSRLALHFLSLAATMGDSGASSGDSGAKSAAAADNIWQKILAESLQDEEVMRSVALILKKVSFLPMVMVMIILKNAFQHPIYSESLFKVLTG